MAQTKEGAAKIAATKAGIELIEYRAKVEAGEKRCSRCGLWKTAAGHFGKDASRYDGRGAACFDCRRVKQPISLKGRVSTFKGHSHTEEARQLMSRAKKGKPAPHKAGPRSPEFRAKVSASLRASANVKRGPTCHSYKDGMVAERKGLRYSSEYRRWRYDVFTRDKFTCQQCGDAKGGNLNAHHIKPFADFPELRFNIANGVTLCQACHDRIHDKPDSTRKRAREMRQARQGAPAD